MPSRAESAGAVPRLPDRRPPSRGEARRAALLKALEELLRTRPLADVGIGDIAETAGVSRSGFYFYFTSKEAAVTELLGDFVDEMLAGASTALTAEGHADPEAVRAAFAGSVAAWRKHRHLILAMLDARAGDDAVRELWDAWMAVFVAPVTKAIAEEQKRGTAKAKADPELLARLLLGMNEHAMEQHLRAEPSAAAAEQLVDAMTEIWLGAIYRVDT